MYQKVINNNHEKKVKFSMHLFLSEKPKNSFLLASHFLYKSHVNVSMCVRVLVMSCPPHASRSHKLLRRCPMSAPDLKRVKPDPGNTIQELIQPKTFSQGLSRPTPLKVLV